MRNFLRLSISTLTLVIGSTSFCKPMTAVLRLKERVKMEDLAASVRSPVSLKYKEVYSPDEIRIISAPPEEEYQSLLSELKALSFQIVGESKTHLWISVRAEAQVFERVFATRIEQLSNHQHRPMLAPRVPAQLASIESVGGLSNTRKLHTKYIVNPNSSFLAAGISQAAIKTAYGFDPIYKAGLTGKGQHIAIATYDGFNIDDVRFFYTDSKLDPMPSVDQVVFNGTPNYDENSALETQLDAEFSGMIAPGASVHVFASATNDDAGELQMFNAILDDNRAKVANYSWGGCETTVSPFHKDDMSKVFARAVAQGVNIMVASGDSGSDSCQDGTNKADWPAANDNIVAVGGTTLRFAKDNTPSEDGWNGSGGGISAIWDLPSWQTSLGAPYLKRSYPDVSFNADPFSGQSVYGHINGAPQYLVIGGTSMSAPQWSGFLTLVGEARANANKSPMGFLNPIIYGYSATDRANLFNDVTIGNNGLYSASKGWDATTGWGSMKADALLSKLSE